MQLYVDLGRVSGNPTHKVPQQLVNVYNVLLNEAKKAHPEDAVLGTLEAVKAPVEVAALGGLTGQLCISLGVSPVPLD
jgi:glycine cleavage system H lipoate-binding protein